MGGGPPSRPRRHGPPRDPPGPGTADCDITLTVDLIGVRRDVAARVSVGDALSVDIVAGPGTVGAVCRAVDGGVVGALAAFPGLSRLLDCLEQGVPYLAEVEEVSATRCVVTVSRIDP